MVRDLILQCSIPFPLYQRKNGVFSLEKEANSLAILLDGNTKEASMDKSGVALTTLIGIAALMSATGFGVNQAHKVYRRENPPELQKNLQKAYLQNLRRNRDTAATLGGAGIGGVAGAALGDLTGSKSLMWPMTGMAAGGFLGHEHGGRALSKLKEWGSKNIPELFGNKKS